MLEKEKFKNEFIIGILFSLVIGIIVSFIFQPTWGSIIFILSLALLPGFFLTALLYLYKLSKEKIVKEKSAKKFNWGVEVNLRRVQIIYNKYLSMLQTAGIMAAGSFVAMIFIAKDFPVWRTGHMIFFPISTLLFITFLYLAFRWWFTLRENTDYLKLQKIE